MSICVDCSSLYGFTLEYIDGYSKDSLLDSYCRGEASGFPSWSVPQTFSHLLATVTAFLMVVHLSMFNKQWLFRYGSKLLMNACTLEPVSMFSLSNLGTRYSAISPTVSPCFITLQFTSVLTSLITSGLVYCCRSFAFTVWYLVLSSSGRLK